MIKVIHKKDENRLLTDCTIYIGRPSPLGNPFIIGRDGTRSQVIGNYRKWLNKKIKSQDKEVLDALRNLILKYKEKKKLFLSCWCKPKLCHGDIVKEVLIKMLMEE